MKFLSLIFYIFIFFDGNSAEDYLKEVQEYINGLTTFEADFIQTNESGKVSYGRFFLKRPRLMKMIYTNPPTYVTVAKGTKITHYNRELKEKTETSIYSSPLSFLLEKKIDFKKIRVLSMRNSSDTIAMKFCKKDEDSEGAITLFFSRNPLKLQKWIIFPNKNNRTGSMGILLVNSKAKHNIPDEEFTKFSK
ncbi:MAG: outer membrane lipoprotein carrier protein LolA [Holosporaceae bacterium]|jgi:outer membrane lipoprotein-sorting protein|nr:outer membrane lipoprotein carrier protein LolA [Holosporaceae bacterium]